VDAATQLARALGPHYDVLRLVGRGGFAEVFEVVDTDLHRRLAVKVLRGDLPWNPATLARFKQEARAIARLNHPNILPIHFVGEADGLVYYAMPYLEGRSLADLLRADGPLSVPRALAIAVPIFEALDHAHRHGLIHRDVKPDNIFVEAATGRPLLLDFGIAKTLDGAGHTTQSGFVVGTPMYMSPEQALGRQDVDARADVYGMGVVLFHMLTGAPPFAGSSSQEIVGQHLSEPVPVSTLERDQIPNWLARVVVRCLAKRPEDRYPSAQAVLDALAQGSGARSPLPVDHATTPTVSMHPAKPRRRTARWIGLAGAVAAGIAWILVGPRPTLIVLNRLVEPVVLTLGDSSRTVAPGDSVVVQAQVGRPLEARWAMVRPALSPDRMLGQEVEGTMVSGRAWGVVRQLIDARTRGGLRFSPQVVNATVHPVRVIVLNPGERFDCRCLIEPGDSLRLGYYPLLPATAVRAIDPSGGEAWFSSVSGAVDSVSGAVRIVVDSLTPRPQVPPQVPADSDTVATPVVDSVPEVTIEEPAADSVEPPRTERDTTNPLKSFLPVR